MKQTFVIPLFLEFLGINVCVCECYVCDFHYKSVHFLLVIVVFNNLQIKFLPSQSNFKMQLTVNRSMVIVLYNIWNYKYNY